MEIFLAYFLPNLKVNHTMYDLLKARTKILLSVSQVKVCDVSQIRQMGDVYNEMTGKPDEVSQDAQVRNLPRKPKQFNVPVLPCYLKILLK